MTPAQNESAVAVADLPAQGEGLRDAPERARLTRRPIDRIDPAGGSGPTEVRWQLGQAPPAHTADGGRIWLVIRNSDVPARTRAEIEQSLAGAYFRLAAPRGLQNETVMLYAPR